MEEVLRDPIIEATAKGITRSLGGNEYAEIIASAMAESGREGISGIYSVTHSRGGTDGQVDNQVKDANKKDSIAEANQREAEQKEQLKEASKAKKS